VAIKVLIDGRKINDGGIGTYTKNLVRSLLLTKCCQVTLLLRSQSAVLPEIAAATQKIIYDAKPHSLSEIFLGPKLDLSNFDIFHAPHYNLPSGIALPTVTTIHDVIHLTHPSRFFLPLLARPLIKRAVRKSDLVLTVSETSAEELLRSGIVSKRPLVIPNGVDSFWSPDSNVVRAGARLLCLLSNLKPHKGHRDLLLAVKELLRQRPELRRDFKLQLVGQGVKQDQLLSEISELGLVDNIELLGTVGDKALRELYRSCSAVVIPSLLEGFGLPMLEAQACGAPVLVRPVPALTELLTAADVVCRDLSVSGLVAGLITILEQRREVDESLDARTRHLARFSLPVLGEQYLDCYQRVLGTAVRRAA
jgi:glycosyltransferase involved in cell wall biosynthesis